MNPATATAAPSASAARNCFRVSARTSGVSANTTRISSKPRAMRVARRQHRMRGAEPLHLAGDLGFGNQPQRLFLDRIVTGSDHHRAGLRAGVARPRAAHGSAASVRRSRASPSARPSACGCPHPPPAPPQGMSCPPYSGSGSFRRCGHSGASPRRKAVRHRRKARVCPPLLLAFRATDSFEDHDAQATGPSRRRRERRFADRHAQPHLSRPLGRSGGGGPARGRLRHAHRKRPAAAGVGLQRRYRAGRRCGRAPDHDPRCRDREPAAIRSASQSFRGPRPAARSHDRAGAELRGRHRLDRTAGQSAEAGPARAFAASRRRRRPMSRRWLPFRQCPAAQSPAAPAQPAPQRSRAASGRASGAPRRNRSKVYPREPNSASISAARRTSPPCALPGTASAAPMGSSSKACGRSSASATAGPDRSNCGWWSDRSPMPVTAAKLCATLANAGLSCQPTTFDGQRLALR